MHYSINRDGVKKSECSCRGCCSQRMSLTIVFVRKDDTMKKLAIPVKDVCVACGVCMKACRKNAITIYKGCYAQVDESKCVGCGLCAKACPAGCINILERSEAK